MCDIAPFQMECIYEEYKDKLISCNVCHLGQALNELWLQTPIIKHFVEPYHCPNFEIKRSDNNAE
jgi:hypothetical protein